MLRSGVRQSRGSDGELAWVYGAAIRASSGEEAARRATLAAMRDAGGGRRRERMVAAVRHALAAAPSEPLAALPPDERETIGLVRILGLDVHEVAAALGLDAREVKSLLRSGLTRLAAA